jgi:acyl transferase domain-containing protein
MAGVNSFGYSGTNAHAILQEAPRIVEGHLADHPANGHHAPELANGHSAANGAAHPAARANELLVLSAKSKASLEELVDRWLALLERDEAPALADLAFTAATGRAHLGHRLAAVGTSKADVAAKLRTWREGRVAKGLAAGQSRPRLRPRVAFMFTGQGAQYAGMTAELYRGESRFAQALDRVAAVMDAELGAPIKDVLYGPTRRLT